VTDAGLPLLEACKSLRAINVGGPGVTDAGLESLGRMTNLRQLGLFGSRVTDAGLAHLDKLTNLEILNLSGLPVTEAGLAHVAGATRLYRLELSGTRVNDASIKGIIAGNWPLNYLGLRDTRVSGNGYALLKTTYPDARISWSEPNQVVALLVLAAGGTVQVRVVGRTEERSVKEARDLPGDYFIVTRYRLSGAGKVPEDLPAKLAALTDPKLDGLEGADFSGGPCDLDRLKVLLPRTITDLTLANTRVNDDNLALLQVFRLRRLSLEGCPVSGRGLAHLKAVPELAQSLADLSLARTQFSDAHTGILRAFPNLRRLDVSGCPVRGPGLTTLKELPELRELILACPTLTDLFAEELGGLRRVERLSLAGSSLTDAGLKHLGGLAQLRDLDLRGTKVTAEGVAALRKALPACDIKADSPGAR
jgi:Leucine-rich repeat (LRR) protein